MKTLHHLSILQGDLFTRFKLVCIKNQNVRKTVDGDNGHFSCQECRKVRIKKRILLPKKSVRVFTTLPGKKYRKFENELNRPFLMSYNFETANLNKENSKQNCRKWYRKFLGWFLVCILKSAEKSLQNRLFKSNLENCCFFLPQQV